MKKIHLGNSAVFFGIILKVKIDLLYVIFFMVFKVALFVVKNVTKLLINVNHLTCFNWILILIIICSINYQF